jgi:hypothetical protein
VVTVENLQRQLDYLKQNIEQQPNGEGYKDDKVQSNIAKVRRSMSAALIGSSTVSSKYLSNISDLL